METSNDDAEQGFLFSLGNFLSGMETCEYRPDSIPWRWPWKLP